MTPSERKLTLEEMKVWYQEIELNQMLDRYNVRLPGGATATDVEGGFERVDAHVADTAQELGLAS